MPCLAPPQARSALSVTGLLSRSVETMVSQPYTDDLDAALNELMRSSFWQTKAGFEQARARLQGTSTLRHDWDTYGADAPNDAARQSAGRVLDLLEEYLLPPSRVAPSAEGGIALLFLGGNSDGEKRAGIELYNMGEAVAATWSGQDAKSVWDLDGSESLIRKAIEQLRLHLAA